MAISKVVLNGVTQMDVTNVTATAATIRSTYTALDASGQLVTGTYEGGGGSAPTIVSLSVTPTETEQVFDGSASEDPIVNQTMRAGSNNSYTFPTPLTVGVTYHMECIAYDDDRQRSYTSNADFVCSTTAETICNYIVINNTSMYGISMLDRYNVKIYEIAVDGYLPVTVGAISSTYIGSGIPTKSSANMTANGATVTAPSGYYSSNGTYTISGGAAFTPATTLTTSPAITVNSSGLITATNSYSTSITPTVTAGYVSVGTAGIVSVAGSKTSQLTTIAATTYNVSTANQTISSARYLTGTQTIRGVTTTNLSASNILSGVTIQVGDSANASRIATVTGNVAFVTYYTGSSAPSSSLGTNGDIYLQS